MADPCRERIAKAVQAVLNTVADQLGKEFQYKRVTVERNRRNPLTDDDLPSLVMFEGDEVPSNDFTGEDGYTLPFSLQAAIAGIDEAGAGFANALRASVQRALLADRTLGGMVRDLIFTDTGSALSMDTPSADTEGFLLVFEVLYATLEGDPFTFENE